MKGASVQIVPIGDLEPNPYRRIEKYRLVEEKLERLIASYNESGFWDGSIQARPHPTKAGKYELAFGHHRKAAAERAGLKQLGVVVAERDCATMLRMMASENAEEFQHSPLVTQETIGAVIEAYGRGEIELEPVHPEAPKQHVYEVAPGGATYTCQTVARFLGWTKGHGENRAEPTVNCRLAFDAWHASQDLGVDVAKYVQGMEPEMQTNLATEEILRSVKAAKYRTEKAGMTPAAVKRAAQAAAKETVESYERAKRSRQVEREALKTGAKVAKAAKVAAGIVAPKQAPKIEVYVQKLIRICETSEPYAVIVADCGRLVPYVDDLDAKLGSDLANALEAMLDRTTSKVRLLAKVLRSGKPERIRQALLEAGK